MQPELKSLYDRATWANPEVRAKMLAAEKHAAEQTRKADDKARLEKAKKAGSSVTGAGAAPATEQPERDLSKIVASAFEEHAA